MTLKELAPYFPYIIWTNNGYLSSLCTVNFVKCNYSLDVPTRYKIEEIKPFLRPLSDLTKPCLPDGKIPIVELAKISSSIYNYDEAYQDDNVIISQDGGSSRFILNIHSMSFYIQNGYGDIDIANHQLQLFQKLYEWHFWLGNQSRFGQDIIDINTLKV